MQVRHIATGTVAEVADHVQLPDGWEPVRSAAKKATDEPETKTAKTEPKRAKSAEVKKTTAAKPRTRKGGKVATSKDKSGKN